MDLKLEKEKLIKRLTEERVLKSPDVIEAFRKVPRENFVPSEYKKYSYIDEPLQIGHDQTISQPYTVAIITEALDAKEGNKILKIGTGSGYQSAILSQLIGSSGQIITIERIPELYEFAKNNLRKYKNVRTVLSDGTLGYRNNIRSERTQKEMRLIFKEQNSLRCRRMFRSSGTRREPLDSSSINLKNKELEITTWVSSPVFDRIIVTAAAPDIPKPLTDQLKPDGKMIIVVKNEMVLIEKNDISYLKRTSLGAFRFVPLIGKFGFKQK